MPRIRDTIRSGSKTSRSSSFSPIPANFIGFPVTARTDSAAPPRVSPSSFMPDYAVDSQRIIEALCYIDCVLTGHRIDYQQNLVRMDLRLDVLQLLHQLFVDVQASSSIQDDNVVAIVLGVFDCIFGNLHPD